MLEVRFHGRGGQGAVTSAEIIAQAAIKQGMNAQAFPSFGPERRGAPVQAFLRVSDKPIRLRSKVYKPDSVLILDPTLITSANPTAGLKKGGYIIINSNKSVEELKNTFPGQNIIAVDASKIAREELGVPINEHNDARLVRATRVVELSTLEEPVRNRFGVNGQKNINAYTRAYNEATVIEASDILWKTNDQPPMTSQETAGGKGLFPWSLEFGYWLFDTSVLSMKTISGNIVDLHNETVFPGTVHIANGIITGIDRERYWYDTYILPGFVDSHVHVESSMLTPAGFARLAVVHGTVATVSDPMK